MYKRVWTPTQTKTAYTGTITFYDSGIVCGELFNDSWLSWEILDRKREDGKIIETLRELSQDYVPFEVLHTETHEAVEDSSGNIYIPGWVITYEMSNPSSQPSGLIKPSLLPQSQPQPPVIQAGQPAPRPPPRPHLPPSWIPPQPQQEVEAQLPQTMLAQASSEKTEQKPTKNRRQRPRQANQKQPLQPVVQLPVSYPPHLQPLAEILLAPPLTQTAPVPSPPLKKPSQASQPSQDYQHTVKGVQHQRRRRRGIEQQKTQEATLILAVGNPSTVLSQK